MDGQHSTLLPGPDDSQTPSGSSSPELGPTTLPAAPPSPTSPAGNNGANKREKGRVRFNSSAGRFPPKPPKSPEPSTSASDRGLSPTISVTRPRPSLLRGASYNSALDVDDDGKAASAAEAQQRAQEVAASMLGYYTDPESGKVSEDSDSETQRNSGGQLLPSAVPLEPIPAVQVGEDGHGSHDDLEKTASERERDHHKEEAFNLVRAHTLRLNENQSPTRADRDAQLDRVAESGVITPDYPDESDYYGNGQPREGVLSYLMKLYRPRDDGHSRRSDWSGWTSPGSSNGFTPSATPSGAATPTRRKWYDERGRSQDTLSNLAKASAILANPNEKARRRPKHKRNYSSSRISLFSRHRMDEEAKITIHIANILQRNEFIIKLCRALMLFGAPTHRLEEYLKMIARVLEIDAQFLYIPDCMIISFDDMSTHTTEVKIVRTSQGVNLGKLKDTHEIYKEVLHDCVGLEEAITRLDDLIKSKNAFPVWLRVVAYGFASATVGPFAFEARPIDLPLAWLLGAIVGILQLVVAPMSNIYSNVFEIVAVVITSFLARAFGSIRHGELFCFSALAQSPIALILPGYMVLCAALELQSRSIVPGSIRIVYAVIFSLFLGYGMTVGTALYGMIDSNAVTSTTCTNQLPSPWKFLFVPLFASCLCYVNQAKWRQMPMMVLISEIGYIVNYFSSKKFSSSPQISNTFGALAIGAQANLYSRLRHGVAAAALLPAIFVQVPSGLAAGGSLLSGLTVAEALTNSTANGTSSSTTTDTANSEMFNVASNMIQIAIGITVGLFLSILIIYPLGKRRSGLFTL